MTLADAIENILRALTHHPNQSFSLFALKKEELGLTEELVRESCDYLVKKYQEINYCNENKSSVIYSK